jgi:hypothetical protein
MAETIFVVSGTETLYMARRLPAREAEDFGCEGSNLMLTSVKRQGPHNYTIGKLTLTGTKIIKLHGRFRGTEGIRARFVPWGDGSEGTFALAGYFCEV